jgi:6-pyruvoyltetrahydropterin/6-carboxytetrahydropterin synthase
MSRPLVQITHRVEFSSSHRLLNPSFSEEENRRTFGKCFDSHGHNYELEVTVEGPVHDATGMVMNLLDLARIIRDKVLEPADHKDLNRDVACLRGAIPTAENLVVAFWREMQPEVARFEGCRLSKIRLFESRDNLVEYLGPSPSSSASS